MHTLFVIVAGLTLLFIFVLVSRIINRSGGGAGGGRAFSFGSGHSSRPPMLSPV